MDSRAPDGRDPAHPGFTRAGEVLTRLVKSTMDSTWYTIDFGALVGIFLTSFLVYAALIVLVRLNGLRSFSKLSSHDFAITVAIGSVVAATVVAPSPSAANGIVALIALFVFKRLISSSRRLFSISPLDNRPLLLMRDGRILEEHLTRAQVTREDLFSKLREANVANISDVHAVVMETTGDVSVLHGNREHFDTSLLEGVVGA